MHQAVIDHITEQWEDDFACVNARRHQTREAGHGRQETRSYIQMPVPEALPGRASWPGLKSIVVVVSECIRDAKETVEVRYDLSSLGVVVKRFAHAVRSHWSIENACHWSLDVPYGEDGSRIRDPRRGETFAWLNRVTLSLLKQHPGRESIAMKRRSCGWDENFLMEVLARSTV